jgi:hypothetical protein
MARKTETEENKPKGAGDEWRDAQRAALKAREAADAAEATANRLASGLAESLLTEHGGQGIMLDGVKYIPKKAPTKKGKDGSDPKAPKHPFQLVRASDRGTVDL